MPEFQDEILAYTLKALCPETRYPVTAQELSVIIRAIVGQVYQDVQAERNKILKAYTLLTSANLGLEEARRCQQWDTALWSLPDRANKGLYTHFSKVQEAWELLGKDHA